MPAATRRKNSGSEAQEHAAGAFPTSISYRITGQDTPLGGRRLILEIEPAVISACQFGLRTRDTGTINPENIWRPRAPAAPGFSAAAADKSHDLAYGNAELAGRPYVTI